MAQMTDPTDALVSLQREYRLGRIKMQRGDVDRRVYLHVDHPQGVTRMTYVTFESVGSSTITALAVFVPCDPVNGAPCFNAGVAVPEAFRKQGRAKKIIEAGIAEMRNGFARTPMKSFWIEGIVAEDNFASQRVAEQVISAERKAVTDSASGTPCFQFLREVVIKPAAG